MEELRFSCCFCGNEVESPDLNPQVIISFMSPHTKEHLEQVWWAHFECFEGSLDPDYRQFREEWYEAQEALDAGV